MSSELAPHPAPVLGGDNRYQSVQRKLSLLAKALDVIAPELEQLLRNQKVNSDRAADLAGRVERADLDPKFVALTSAVAVALGGAAVQAKLLQESANEVAGLTHDAKRTHARLYQGLDEVRSGRRERTPKPGFFAH